MDFDRNSMTVPVQSSDYTKKFLQKGSNPTTMEVVTQTNAVKSPTDGPATTKLVYTVEEIARMLATYVYYKPMPQKEYEKLLLQLFPLCAQEAVTVCPV